MVLAKRFILFPILKIFCSHEVAPYQQSWLHVNMAEVIPTYSAQSSELANLQTVKMTRLGR